MFLDFILFYGIKYTFIMWNIYIENCIGYYGLITFLTY